MTERTIDISEGDVTVKELVRRFGPRARVTVKDGGRVVGRFVLRPKTPEEPRQRMLGLHEGIVLFMADDFDAPLPDDFWLSGDP